jgi:hypothetical protein
MIFKLPPQFGQCSMSMSKSFDSPMNIRRCDSNLRGNLWD